VSTAPIGPIAPIAAILPTPAAAPTPSTAGTGADFASAMANGLDQLQQLQTNADNLAVQAADGTLSDPAQYLTASTEASLATQLTVAVRNKAVDAFNEIMRMQA
jgi:flagellar hook-basal body complex protein FliE